MHATPGTCYGRLDLPLRASAERDIAAVLAALRGVRPATILTSPSRRCRILADAVSATCGAPVAADPRLLELDFGDWEGMAWDDVARADLDRWAADLAGFAPPRGETGRALIARVRDAYRSIPAGGCRVVVSHGGPLRVLSALAAGQPVDLSVPAQAPGEVRLFRAALPDRSEEARPEALPLDSAKGSPLESIP